MIRVVCACGRVFKAEDRHAGKRTKCPVCGAMLTIGQTPVTSSSGGDVDEVPSWWYPSDPQGQVDGSGLPPRLGGDPGTASQTAVLPAGADPKGAAHRVNSARLAKPGPGAPLPDPARLSSRVRRLWILSAGTAALAVSALVYLVAMRPVAPGGSAPTTKGLPVVPAKARDLAGDSSAPQLPESGRAAQPPSPLTETGNERSGATAKAAATSSGSTTAAPEPGRPESVGSPGSTARLARRLRLLVPAYIYPGGAGRKHWQKLIEAAAKVELVVIANPSSGPGRERNPDYAAIFTEAANRGVKLIGYVSTQYAGRSRAEVKEDIDAWVRYYPQIAGFFFDQQPSAAEYHHMDYYAEIRTFAKGRLRDPLVITNPGIACEPAYLAQAVSDVTCVFANFEGFAEFELPAPLRTYDASRFAALVYNVANADAMRGAVKDAIVKKIGYVYVSDETPPTQWGRLPTYWEAEVEAVSRVQ